MSLNPYYYTFGVVQHVWLYIRWIEISMGLRPGGYHDAGYDCKGYPLEDPWGSLYLYVRVVWSWVISYIQRVILLPPSVWLPSLYTKSILPGLSNGPIPIMILNQNHPRWIRVLSSLSVRVKIESKSMSSFPRAAVPWKPWHRPGLCPNSCGLNKSPLYDMISYHRFSEEPAAGLIPGP